MRNFSAMTSRALSSIPIGTRVEEGKGQFVGVDTNASVMERGWCEISTR